jgi:hypothetical protein
VTISINAGTGKPPHCFVATVAGKRHPFRKEKRCGRKISQRAKICAKERSDAPAAVTDAAVPR